MNRFRTAIAMAALSTSLPSGLAFAQDRDHHDNDNHKYVEHQEWKKGGQIKHEDWDRGEKIDYRTYHLNAPPRGYEWRLVDGNYLLVNTGSFQIHTVIVAR